MTRCHHADFPQSIWKMATVISIPKPCKHPSTNTSYLPSSLICPETKVLEPLVLPLINPHLNPVTDQHSFRPGHSVQRYWLCISFQLSSTTTTATMSRVSMGTREGDTINDLQGSRKINYQLRCTCLEHQHKQHLYESHSGSNRITPDVRHRLLVFRKPTSRTSRSTHNFLIIIID